MAEELQELLRKSWSQETSADPEHWTPKNPAWGQCAISARVGYDFKGGEILRTKTKMSIEGVQTSHYWNRFPDGKEVDFTKEQFPKGTVIPEAEPCHEDYIFKSPNARKRYALLRLSVENLIRPNPLFLNPIYRMCLQTAMESECQKMRFGCLIFYNKEKKIITAANNIIEPLRNFCEPECIRFKIQSRTESMLGACGHAEEWALWATVKLEIPPKECSLYIAGFDAKTSKPWIKKEAADHTCLRCAVQMYMADIGKIWVPFIDHWESLTPKEAVEKSAAYALKDKKI